MDFVQDHLATGTKLRIPTVIDTFSRYTPVIDPRLAYHGADVVSALDRVCKEMGHPGFIRFDQRGDVSREFGPVARDQAEKPVDDCSAPATRQARHVPTSMRGS